MLGYIYLSISKHILYLQAAKFHIFLNLFHADFSTDKLFLCLGKLFLQCGNLLLCGLHRL